MASINKTFNINEPDLIRIDEHFHDVKLKKELEKFGLEYEVKNFRPHGMRKQKQKFNKENFKY